MDKDYDLGLHFTKKCNIILDPSSKAKAFSISNQGDKDKVDVLVGFHNNSIKLYQAEIKKSSEKKTIVKNSFGDLEAHMQGVRGIAVA